MLAKYQSELSILPKGAISEKKVGEKTYYYLKYRDGKKVISQYVSKKDMFHFIRQHQWTLRFRAALAITVCTGSAGKERQRR